MANSAEVTSASRSPSCGLSAVASAIVDNIPFVATMIDPETAFVQLSDQGSNLDLDQQHAIWWSLGVPGGNGSLIGASAKLTVAGFAERAGSPIRFITFPNHAFPLMLFWPASQRSTSTCAT